MLRSYLKTAFRNLRQQKIYTAINLLGTTITLTVCIFIFLFVRDELSYDSFFKNSNNIYRVTAKAGGDTWGRVDIPVDEMKRQMPDISSFTRIMNEEGVAKTEKVGIDVSISIVDSSFFNVFSFPLIYGDKLTVLNDEHSIVLSKSTSDKLFGNTNPVGKKITLLIGINTGEFLITGVTSKIPNNSSIKFSVLIPFSSRKAVYHIRPSSKFEGTSDLAPSLFIKLPSNINTFNLSEKFNRIMNSYLTGYSQNRIHFLFQSLKNIHLSPHIIYSMQPESNPIYSYILFGLGILILLLSSINFINLNIARSSHRFKEIGIRKVIGADKRKIILQFIFEALTLSFLSLIIALVLIEFLLPSFNQITDKHLSFNFYNNLAVITWIIFLTMIVGLLAGGYPAIYFSTFKPVNILRGELKFSGNKSLTRIMVIFQFIISTGLLISALIMFQQFNYIQNKNLGFNKENVVIIKNRNFNKSNFYNEFKSNISEYAGVKTVSWCSQIPGEFPKFNWSVINEKNNVKTDANLFDVGFDYLKALGIKLKAGRDFSPNIRSDSINSVILNETLVKRLQTNYPIDKVIKINTISNKYYKVIGVVKDFNFTSLKHRINPLVIDIPGRATPLYILVRLNPGNLFDSMKFLRKKWNELSDGTPFDYTFLDEQLNNQYESEIRWNKIINYSAFFAIFVALLGILGLAAYSVEKRIKEISIRKVLGASLYEVMQLFIKGILKLILISCIMAMPIAYLVMSKWLSDFAYRTNISLWTFLFASFIVVLISLIVIIFQVNRAATANPVESLKYE